MKYITPELPKKNENVAMFFDMKEGYKVYCVEILVICKLIRGVNIYCKTSPAAETGKNLSKKGCLRIFMRRRALFLWSIGGVHGFKTIKRWIGVEECINILIFYIFEHLTEYGAQCRAESTAK